MNHVGGVPLFNDDLNALSFSISDLSICQAFRRFKVAADMYQRTLPYTVKAHLTSPYYKYSVASLLYLPYRFLR